MSLLLNQGTLPKGLQVKSHDYNGPSSNTITIGEYDLSMADFCAVVKYAMDNTDLGPDDPRVKLLREIQCTRIIPGWNAGRERIAFFDPVHAVWEGDILCFPRKNSGEGTFTDRIPDGHGFVFLKEALPGQVTCPACKAKMETLLETSEHKSE